MKAARTSLSHEATTTVRPSAWAALDGVADLCRDREAELGGKRGATGDDGVAAHDALDTEAGAAAEAVDRRQPTTRRGGARDRPSDGMLGAGFHGADDPQRVVAATRRPSPRRRASWSRS